MSNLTRRYRHFWDPGTKGFASSLLFHLCLLLACGLLAVAQPSGSGNVSLIVSNDRERDDLMHWIDLEVTADEAPSIEVGAERLGQVEQAAPTSNPEPPRLPSELMPSYEPAGAVADVVDLVANHKADLFANLAGVRGAVVTTQGDIGSVDRITAELLGRLEMSDVLVVWLMDASESLRPRREQIIQHFNRVYDELEEVAGDYGDSLLTSVVAFAAAPVLMTDEPTADRQLIRQAVRDIKADASGIENVFTAIKMTAVEYAEACEADREVLMIVVTDEAGNDLAVLDDALGLCRQHHMSVFVIGPPAPFSRREISVKWVDAETSDTHYLPVDCGPETAAVEQANLEVWDDGPGSQPTSSGFGPYGLTRITHENGGLYLLVDDGRIPGPTFEARALADYQPDYSSPADYLRQAQDNPLRVAVLRTSEASNTFFDKPLPRVFLAAGIQFEIRTVQRELVKTVNMLNRGLSELKAVEQYRGKETSARWLAHHDLMMGRLLANKIRCYSYGRLLAEMYERPRMPQDGTKNAWALASYKELTEEEVPEELREEFRWAQQYLQRVIDEHPNTPWSAIAEEELKFALAFQWQESFQEPPVGVPLPWDKKPWDELTEAQKKAKVAFDTKKKKQAEKKKETKGTAKRLPPKL